MMARLLKLAYQLRMHRLGDAQLDVLGRNLAFLAAAAILIQWLLRGRPILPVWHWLAFGLLIAGALGLIVLRIGAAHAGYVQFTQAASLTVPAPREMNPDDKAALFATGRFEVAEKRGYLADTSAYWRTFGTREHTVMAIQHASRFLLGSLPPDQIGMWYVFFRPDDVDEVTPGVVAFGGARRPGLRVIYRSRPPAEGMKSKKPARETVYLAFENGDGRDRVWADLLADQGPARRASISELPGIRNVDKG